MARPSTTARVHNAALALVAHGGPAAATMAGIAERAGVGKQTLYRSWPSPGAILFDALLARSADAAGDVVVPDTGDLPADLEALIAGAAAELADPAVEPAYRALTAAMQSDAALAEAFEERLRRPQLAAVEARLRTGGVADADELAELLLAPVAQRWLVRLPSPSEGWAGRIVARVLAAARPAGPLSRAAPRAAR